jgi:hypothetical protein
MLGTAVAILFPRNESIPARDVFIGLWLDDTANRIPAVTTSDNAGTYSISMRRCRRRPANVHSVAHS